MRIRNRIDVDLPSSDVPIPPPEKKYPITKVWGVMLILITIIAVLYFVLNTYFPSHGITKNVNSALASDDLWIFILIGVIAQTIDGALGMAYGVSANSLLLTQGVPPAAATSAVHLSEVFTTGFSGFSHWRMGNVNKSLFLRLLIPGAIGAVLGVYIVSSIDGKVLKPYISLYLLIMGVYILRKAFQHRGQQVKTTPNSKTIAPLALLGGFVDSVGGGGWGPVVTTTLLGRGHAAKQTIGSVNAAEFFLTIASATAFAALVGFGYWTVIVGLVLGGLLSAPFAAWFSQHLSNRQLLIIVGFLISGLSIWNIYKSWIS